MTPRPLSIAFLALAACTSAPAPEPTPAPVPAPVVAAPAPDTARQAAAARDTTPPPAPVRRPAHAIVPAPASIAVDSTVFFVVDTLTTTVTIDSAAGREVQRLARIVARMIDRDTAPAVLRLPSRLAGLDTGSNTIYLGLDTTAVAHAEGYVLTVFPGRVQILARTPEGLFRGIQTLRQLFPFTVEHPDLLGRRLRLPGVRVEDAPRFAWRGSMLDVSRHFLPLEDVKRHVDLMALYKLNRLHLHLSDDQGWRLEIRKHPRLTTIGAKTQVGGGAGGFYTQAQFRELVRYARDRYVMVIPEFDMPGHTNAALASIPSLNCDRKSPPLYTGIKVGFSAVCAEREATYRWVDDVIREVAAISPAPYIHIGGDEVEKIAHPQYIKFVERVEKIVRRHGKRAIGWAEIAPANLDTTTIAQLWRGVGRDSTAVHAARGGKVLMSPGPKMYIDMKYDSATALGLRWAGLVSLRTVYDWDPATYQPGVTEASIVGVEAPLWSETLVKYADFQYLAFPRLLAVAEMGWTPQQGRDWEEFRLRLVPQGQRLQALGVNFYRSPDVSWVP